MSQPARSDAESRSAGLALVEAWTDYVKTAGMYPETSLRVAQRLDDLLTAIDDIKSAQGTAVVRMGTDEITVGSESIALTPTSKALWLHQRMHKSALEGVAFLGRESAEGLPGFARQLRQNHARRDEVDSDTLWPETYTGLELLHRRFTDGFHGGGPEISVPPSLSSVTSLGAKPVADPDPANAEPLTTRLANEAALTARVGDVRSRLEAAGLLGDGDEEAGEALGEELIEQLVETLPDDGTGYGGVVRVAEGMLGCLDEYLEKAGPGVDELTAGAPELKGLLFMASRMFFRGEPVVPEPREEPTTEQRVKGRAGDEKFTADIEAFMDELRALPEMAMAELTADPAELRAEVLDVYLSMLAVRKSDQPTNNLHQTLGELLARPTRSELAIVGRHLRASWAEDGPARERMANFLEAEGLSQLLRRCGILTDTYIETVFPRDFEVYLDALDFTTDADRTELRRLLANLGDKRILDAAPELMGRMTGERARRLLAFDAPESMAFASALLRVQDRHAIEIVSKRLRLMRPDIPVARLMELTHDAKHITADYLAGVVDVLTGAEPTLQLRTHAARCLKDVIEHLADTEGPESPRRMDAIRVAGALRVPSAMEFLRRLGKRRKLLLFHAEPRYVRETISEALTGRVAGGRAA